MLLGTDVSIVMVTSREDSDENSRRHGALLLSVVGVVWILQGINVLPGSFMSGWPAYAVPGLVGAVVGLVILLRSARRRPSVVGPRF